jgi:NAD(P)-dependent dehydrogenase (short-subunit alcohol dehydrogenase family)
MESNLINLLDHTGQIDHIVWTAGDGIAPTPIGEATLEAIEHAATLRYVAPILLAKHAPKYLKNSFESTITLTTGVGTERPIPNWSVITGSRSAVIGLGKNLALDLRPIRVNVVSLGAVDTDTWSHLPQEAREKTFQALVTKSTTGRIADASDVAEAYIYCMKDRNVTGSVISTNGGTLLV